MNESGRVHSGDVDGIKPSGFCRAHNYINCYPCMAGRLLSPDEILANGLRKAVKDEDTEWVDANIVRLLLRNFDLMTPARTQSDD